MRVIISLILTIFFIIKIKTFSEFKVIRLSHEKMLIIAQKGMTVYSNYKPIVYKNFSFTFNGTDLENTSFFVNSYYVFFLLKNNLCIFFDESKELICKNFYQNNYYKFGQITMIEDVHHNSYYLNSLLFFPFNVLILWMKLSLKYINLI